MTIKKHLGGQRKLFIGIQTEKNTPSKNLVQIPAIEFEDGSTTGSIAKKGMVGYRQTTLGKEKTEEFSESSLKLNLGMESSKVIFSGFFGEISESTPTGKKITSFLPAQDIEATYLTIVWEEGGQWQRIINAVVNTISLSGSEGGFIETDISLIGEYKTSITDPKIKELSEIENQFTFKTFSAKFAKNIAGLETAKKENLNTFSLNLNNGVISKKSIGVNLLGELKTGGSFEKDKEESSESNESNSLKENKERAMSFNFEHDNNDKIEIVFGKVQIDSIANGGSLSDIRTETVVFEDANFDISTKKSIEVKIIKTVKTTS